ncbi:MAG TPA: YdcH family protein [Alphaproteobacteria bacterium]|jgi:hypothetical protein
MAVEQRIETLKASHASIEAAIHSERSRPHPDDVRVHGLKREKLRIKDEISRLRPSD